MLIVVSEVEIVFDERNADVRVVADAATMDDRIYQRNRAQNRFLSIADTIAANPRIEES